MSLLVANARRAMSEWLNWWMLRLPETINQGIDTSCGCNCHCLCLWFLSVARVRSEFGMIARASGLGMGVGWFWSPLGEVGLLAMPDARLDTTRRVESACEVPPSGSVVRLRVPGAVVGVSIDRRWVGDGVEVTRRVLSATPELFSEDEGVEFWPWIVDATELSH